LPPIKKPENEQQKSAGNVRSASPVNPLANKRIEQPSKSVSESSGEMGELSESDRVLIEKACRLEQYSGPAAYRECQRRQVATARNSGPVSFEGVPQSDRVLIEKACRLEQYSGPAAYRECQRRQVRQLKATQTSTSDRK